MMTRNEGTGRAMHMSCLDGLAFTWSVHMHQVLALGYGTSSSTWKLLKYGHAVVAHRSGRES